MQFLIYKFLSSLSVPEEFTVVSYEIKSSLPSLAHDMQHLKLQMTNFSGIDIHAQTIHSHMKEKAAFFILRVGLLRGVQSPSILDRIAANYF